MYNRAKHGDSILQEVGLPHLEEIGHFGSVTADNKTNVRKRSAYTWCGRHKEINSLSVG
jgi:hypothetical protein